MKLCWVFCLFVCLSGKKRRSREIVQREVEGDLVHKSNDLNLAPQNLHRSWIGYCAPRTLQCGGRKRQENPLGARGHVPWPICSGSDNKRNPVSKQSGRRELTPSDWDYLLPTTYMPPHQYAHTQIHIINTHQYTAPPPHRHTCTNIRRYSIKKKTNKKMRGQGGERVNQKQGCTESLKDMQSLMDICYFVKL